MPKERSCIRVAQSPNSHQYQALHSHSKSLEMNFATAQRSNSHGGKLFFRRKFALSQAILPQTHQLESERKKRSPDAIPQACQHQSGASATLDLGPGHTPALTSAPALHGWGSLAEDVEAPPRRSRWSAHFARRQAPRAPSEVTTGGACSGPRRN